MEAVRGIAYLKFHCFWQKIKLAVNSMSTCKTWWRTDDPRPNYCVFSIFKMAAVRHLGFSYFRNIYQKFILALISPSTCKIWRRLDDPRRSNFLIIKMVTVPIDRNCTICCNYCLSAATGYQPFCLYFFLLVSDCAGPCNVFDMRVSP